ncbi:PREDICTED: cytohesin-interacting protein-like, partial [Chlamydotis macqueenii]|uniref:cytohesin-interacting protein-like n=1 Tax=Chlamydotis macqueenii TaxID=187382 RepID=UPI000529B3E2
MARERCLAVPPCARSSWGAADVVMQETSSFCVIQPHGRRQYQPGSEGEEPAGEALEVPPCRCIQQRRVKRPSAEMALRRLIQQTHTASFTGFEDDPAGGEQALPMDGWRIQHLANALGTLPRGRKQLALARTSSLGDPSRPQRHLVAILKEDKEMFGFEIQTIRFPHQNGYSLEVCTCVCKIQEESPAHLSGLQTGDILASINGVSTDGFSHKQVVGLIKSSGNYLRLETVNGAMLLRKMELETKLQLLT